MGKQVHKRLILTLSLLIAAAGLSFAQNTSGQDSLVRLMKAKSLELIEKYGRNYRKTVDATFMHNGTYLVCDTALWNVDEKIINCWGHVQLIQDETVLTSEKLDYLVDADLAQFRGRTVQLRNKKDNILRTRNLDYNTRDSIAIFRGGAAMRDKDGQVIESREGTYNSKQKLFTFKDDVNMYTDSVFVRTSDLIYDGERRTADFIAYVDFWKDGNMLSAGKGWYNRADELFFFEQDVHGLSKEQEVWCDTMYFYRTPQDVLMLGHAHVQDDGRKVAGMANYIFYQDSIAKVTLKHEAAVAMETEQENEKGQKKVDTLYMGADTLIYKTIKMCDIPDGTKSTCASRLEAMFGDPVAEFRRKAAEEAVKAAEEARKNDVNAAAADAAAAKRNARKAGGPAAAKTEEAAPAEEEEKAEAEEAPGDTTSVNDSLKAPDTTKVGFLTGIKNVKVFRKDMQVRCDSLCYCDLDSIARFYIKPIVWNDGNRQYTSDSLNVLVMNGGVDRASLMGNAFIITQEDSLYFDQIAGTEVMAYFDTSAALKRFDALGGATAIFFLQENDAFATVNKVESKMLSAMLEKGQLDKVYYYESPKNDAYPIAQMEERDLKMKAFNWNPGDRPRGRLDITTLKVKPSERVYYEGRPRASFPQTDIYFPGYMKSVYDGIEADRQRRREAQRARQEAENATAADTVSHDTLSVKDTLLEKLDTIKSSDTLDVKNVMATDTLKVGGSSAGETAAEDAEAKPKEGASVAAVAAQDSGEALQDAGTSPAQAADTLTAKADTLSAADSLALLRKAERDKKLIAYWARQDSIKAVQKAKREARDEKHKLAIARRDAIWAVKDSIDAAKQAVKSAGKQDKTRARTRKAVMAQMLQDAKDQAKLDKYVKRYEKRKAREDARAQRREKWLQKFKSPKKEEPAESEDEKGKLLNKIDNEQESVPARKRAPQTGARRDVQAPPESGE